MDRRIVVVVSGNLQYCFRGNSGNELRLLPVVESGNGRGIRTRGCRDDDVIDIKIEAAEGQL